MNLTKILAIVLFVVSLGLAYYLYNNINQTIVFKESILTTEKQITDKLAIIREAEKVYLEQHGHYTANWDSLIQFIEHGQVPVIVRTEKITPLSYGEEKVEVIIDTIDFISAKDKIFKKTYAINATAEGTFGGFLVKEGDFVVKSVDSYKIKESGKPKATTFQFNEQGTVSSVAKINVGDPVVKGQSMITLWDYVLNPSVDIKTLSAVPGSDKPFGIYVGKILRGGVKVSVIEVTDLNPINPERKASNEAKNRQPLGFGSKVDVGTSGNWE
ncbi:MAG TPA: hypothetical protein PLJ60_16620 [Chryseolinea sp.]|nr:hypothetical protein [Chryseolinea sp.]